MTDRDCSTRGFGPGFKVSFRDCGDSALLIGFEEGHSRELSRFILGLSNELEHAAMAGLIESAPAFSSLTVFYDPLVLRREDLVASIEPLLSGDCPPGEPSRTWTIPVLYGGGGESDLKDIASATGKSEAEVASLHSSAEYHVYMLGFLPGFAYLGDLPAALDLPRRATPRQRVPAGAVAIAAGMTAIYPLDSPGGWHILGQTPIPMWDMSKMDMPLLRPGDRVRFKPVDASEDAALREQIAAGWLPTPMDAT